MFLVVIKLLNSTFQTYLQSLKKDLGKDVFESIILIAVLSWIGLLIAVGIWVAGKFHMPSDPLFYLFWFALALSTELTFTAFLLGMLNTSFFAANSFENISFVITTIFAAIFLHETYSLKQATAIAIALLGSLLFFQKKDVAKSFFAENKGLFLVLFSLLLTPVEYILYKSATLHTNSYNQFLTGRLVMDAFFYTLFFILVTVVWYRKNPFPKIRSLLFSTSGLTFAAGSTVAELVESWLVFKMPIGLFTVLGTITIPASYFINRTKYGDKVRPRDIIGSFLIIAAVILFVL